MRRSYKREINIFILGVLIGFALLVVIKIPVLHIKEKIIIKTETKIVIEIKEVFVKYLTRMEINDKLLKENNLISTYASLFDNKKEIIKTIINVALEKEVPVNTAISMATIESNLNPKAVNDTREYRDIGLFQLNSQYFKNIDYFNVTINANTALKFFKDLYKKSKNWEAAIVYYNAGYRTTNIPTNAIIHLNKVLIEEEKLDKLFNERIVKNVLPKENM